MRFRRGLDEAQMLFNALMWGCFECDLVIDKSRAYLLNKRYVNSGLPKYNL